ncbi:MAG: DUF4279 domain-containing protein [Sedimenticola sp.]|nr:DUF4279 domain-containing protein [Sedimenticola sp.]MCW8976097.1 DUF4279 domain-containing protein [Sedimenticola sp.]
MSGRWIWSKRAFILPLFPNEKADMSCSIDDNVALLLTRAGYGMILVLLVSFCLYDINARHIHHHNEGNILASNQARAYFTLSGYHFNPDDITRLIGIQPTSINAAGAASGLDKPVISSWELSTDTITDDVDVYDLTGKLIKQVEPAKEKILQVIKSHNLSPRIGVVLVLSIDKAESAPDVGFGARTIRFLADIGAFINVDYQLAERI